MTPDDLDKQIRAALGGDPSAGQLARIERFWSTRSRAERRRRWRRVTAAAASLALVAVASWLIGRGERREAAAPAIVAEAPRPLDNRSPPVTVADSAPAGGREPTAYERLAFTMQTRAPASPERTLAARLKRAMDDDERRRLVRQMGERGTLQSVPALLQAAERADLRDDALLAVERIAGVDRLADVVRQAQDAGVRAALMERLLEGNSPATVRGYLSLAADPVIRDEALAAAAAAEPLPLAALLRLLDDDEKSVRASAATVLGYVNGPQVSQALISRVSRSERAPVEAWVALLACRGAPVDQFLAEAVVQPRLLGQVNSARTYWARVVP